MDSDSDSDSISDNRRMAQRERNLRWEPQNCSADLKRVFKTVGEFWDSMFERDEFSLKYTALEAAQLKELFVLIAANNPKFRNTKRERRMVYQALYQCRKGVPDSSIRDMWVVQSRFHHRKAYTWILRALPDLVRADKISYNKYTLTYLIIFTARRHHRGAGSGIRSGGCKKIGHGGLTWMRRF